MQPVLVKAYGYFKPAGPEHLTRLTAALESCGLRLEDSLSLEGRLLLISYEGTFFPVEEAAAAFGEFIREAGERAEARLDILELEEWRLDRYQAAEVELRHSRSPLNNTLEYSRL